MGIGYLNTTAQGSKTDVGAELAYNIAEGTKARVFGQTTIASDDPALKDTILGVGGSAKINEKLTADGEVSYALDAQQVAARLGIDYAHNDRTNFYAGYETGFRTNSGTGSSSGAKVFDPTTGKVTVGGKTRFTDSLSVFGEEHLIHEGWGVTGLTHSYGVNYTPNDNWSLSSAVEVGNVKDVVTGNDLRRIAASGSVGFSIENSKIGAALEYRSDTNAAGEEARTWLAKANASYKVDPSWRLSAKVAAFISDKNGQLQNGNFIDGDIGAAYRPIDNDRLNALFKYRFYADLPSDTVANAANGAYKQRSHILSADVAYDVMPQLTIGAKYGLKLGQRTLNAASNNFYSSTAHLGIVRADFHIVKNWDALLEGRILHHQENQQTKYGALVGVYRHIGDNFKIGGGYNFSSISDNLTNTDANASGWFINAIAKF